MRTPDAFDLVRQCLEAQAYYAAMSERYRFERAKNLQTTAHDVIAEAYLMRSETLTAREG